MWLHPEAVGWGAGWLPLIQTREASRRGALLAPEPPRDKQRKGTRGLRFEKEAGA